MLSVPVTGVSTSTLFSVLKMGTGVRGLIVFSNRLLGVSATGSALISYALAGTPLYFGNGASVGTTRGDVFTAFSGIQANFTVTALDLSAWTAYTHGTSATSPEYLQETIVYGSDKSSDRAAIETNINEYYSIY